MVPKPRTTKSAAQAVSSRGEECVALGFPG